MATNYLTDVMGTGLMKPTAQQSFPVGAPQGPYKQPATPAPTPTAPRPTTTANAPSANLNQSQQTLLKKNNPELYNKLYGTAPVEVDVGDVGKEGLTVGTQGTTTSKLSSSLSNTGSIAQRNLAQSQVQTENQPNTLQTIQQQVIDLMAEGQDFDPAQIKAEAGVYDQQDRVNQLSQSYDTALVEQRRRVQEMRQNPEGKLAGALQADIQNYVYESDQNLADKAMMLHYAQADYQGALEIANDKIKSEEQRYQRQMDGFKTLYSMVQDDMTASEKMMFQSQLSMQEYGFKNYTDTKNTALQAAGANGAPPEVLAAITNAQTVDDIWLSAGQYGVDPNLTLARDKFAVDRDLAYKRYNLELAKMVGDISTETANKQLAQAQADATMEKAQFAIEEILGNTLGFQVATGKARGPLGTTLKYGLGGATGGALAGSVIPGVGTVAGGIAGFLGAGTAGYLEAKQSQEELANNMDFIASNLTTQALADAKARGVTFGALSDTELKIIGGAADILSPAWNAEDMTFRGSPQQIEKALTDMYNVLGNKRTDTQLGTSKASLVEQAFNTN